MRAESAVYFDISFIQPFSIEHQYKRNRTAE